MKNLSQIQYRSHFTGCMPAGFKNFIFIYILALPSYVSAQSEVKILLHAADSVLLIEQEAKAVPFLKQLENMKLSSSADKLYLQYLKGQYFNSLEDNKKAAEILLDLPEKAESEKVIYISVLANILLSLINEKTDNLKESKNHLNKANVLIMKYGLDSLYAWYCVRNSSLYRYSDQPDSAIHYAKLAISYGEKFHQMRAWSDGYLLMGALHSKESMLSLQYFQSALNIYKQVQNLKGISYMYHHMSSLYLGMGDPDKALMYNDSAINISTITYLPGLYHEWKNRSEIYAQIGLFDSALFFYKKYNDGMIQKISEREGDEIKLLTERYELEKKNTTISIKEKQLKVTLIIALLTALASMALYRQNKKIKNQNKQIQSQLGELNKLIQQKQILLKELQHRVKNNLQHVLSLMDIQKESLNYNTVTEVIRENHNRVHSMALLHNKLSYIDGSETVSIEDYLQDLTALIKAAYFDPEKEINIQINCKLKQLDIDTAIPLGLVVVELLSNSFKHAFNDLKAGDILLSLSYDLEFDKKLLIYSDNGCGFNITDPPKNGLGLELIHGLVKEINATFNSDNQHGTKYTILF